jgi:hypothetical protein
MKAPAPLLLLALAVASPAHAAAARCDDAQLAQIQGVLAQGGTPAANKNLKAEPIPGGERWVFDVASAPKICDRTVWRYLAAKAPGGLVLQWSDEGLQQDWSAGLAEQTKILLAVDALYGKADALGKSILSGGQEVLNAAVKIGVVSIKTGEGTGRVIKEGYSGEAYAAAKGFTVGTFELKDTMKAAGAPLKLDAASVRGLTVVPKSVAPSPEDLKAALNKLLTDVPATKSAPAAVKLGPAPLEFRKSVIRLADLLAAAAARREISQKFGVDAKVTADFLFHSSGPTWAPSPADANGRSVISDETAGDDAVYGAALKYVTDPAITEADDESPRDSAALSRLDYGLRNMIAIDAAGVDAAVKAAKDSLKGQSAAAALAAARRDAKSAAEPGAPKPGTLAADVLEKLKGVKKYQDLAAMYDAKTKADDKWLSSEDGRAVAAQLKSLRADAGRTAVVKDAKGSRLDYGVAGDMTTADGIVVAKLDKDQSYRTWAAETIAKNIASNPLSAKAQAALDAFLGEGAPGTPAAKPLTPEELTAAKLLGPQPAAAAAPPAGAWDALVAATPASGFFGGIGDLFSGNLDKGNAARYYSKVSEDAARTASERTARRAEIETDADAAASAAKRAADAERKKITQAPPDPDDSAAVAAAKRKAALAAHDAQAATDVAAARKKVVDDARTAQTNPYADAAQIAADEKAALDALNAKVDAAYSDGIAQSLEKLHADYALAGSPRRLDAENQSGYSGAYYKLDRVDRYFRESWQGDKQKAAIAACKTSLGFQAAGGDGNFKDPSPANVDELCGVRDGLVALLKAYRGTNTQLPVQAK